MPNSLFRQASLRFGPIVLETLVKHYFDRILKDGAPNGTQLRSEELLYDEAFTIVKTFLEAAAKHTVEELQGFSNTRTPSPPWVHVVRLVIPMSCCDDAATHLIQALGGEETTKKVVGGTKWWQVRGLKGIDAEWITSKKDWQEAQKRHKTHERERSSTFHQRPASESTPAAIDDDPNEGPATYEPEMDAMRCILYVHGGGYYFGSVDQERYSIQRHARKINGRVFAVNYRLAPQYPFPCAIQDVLTAYLYLIRPPEGALHRPVLPEHIVVMGDSAGGGLCIALLQVLRDTGLPMPAGGVLISPWCDLTHSFPSVHTNTTTDVLPRYGLSFHKPSTLWPPPPDELTIKVHEGIRSRIHEFVFGKDNSRHESVPQGSATDNSARQADHNVSTPDGETLRLGSTASLPLPDASVHDQTISLVTADGERISVDKQIHLYTTNSLLTHPLVSPVLSYMGGLPPLLVIVSDKEVLRDEIVYLAHKAAHPDKYPLKDTVRFIYPPLRGIEERFGPTKVHLQVYDDTAHTLPVLFSFTTPAKYCFRAIANFMKHTTGMPLQTASTFTPIVMTLSPTSTPSFHLPSPASGSGSGNARQSTAPQAGPPSSAPASRSASLKIEGSRAPSPSPAPDRKSRSTFLPRPRTATESQAGRRSLRRSISASAARVNTLLGRSLQVASPSPVRDSTGSGDAAGPDDSLKAPRTDEAKFAGDPSVYDNGLDVMIRERVSTRGVLRPLESEEELAAFRLPSELVGVVSELALRRYIDGLAKFSKKFAKTTKSIEKQRSRNIDRAKRDTLKNMSQLQNFIDREGNGPAARHEPLRSIKEGLNVAGSWSWVWALDADENPPPSSIVSRRDTEEARRLAKIADQAVLMDEHAISGNNLWSLIIDFLTVHPVKNQHHHQHRDAEGDSSAKQQQHRSKFAQFAFQRRKSAQQEQQEKT